MKKSFRLSVVLLFFLTACEKESSPIPPDSPYKFGKGAIVKIEDVPFLQPSIEKFNSRARMRRGIEDLDLDYSKIVQFLGANGINTYTIPIKKNAQQNDDDYYFENLNIVQKDGEFTPFVVKYDPDDDSEEFKITEYTGKMEIMAIDRFSGLVVNFLNGSRIVPPEPPRGPEQSGGGGNDPNSFWCWLFGTCWNQNPDSGPGFFTHLINAISESCNCNNGSGGSGAVITNIPFGTSGTGAPTGNNNPEGGTSGPGTVVIVPLQPAAPLTLPASRTAKAKAIGRLLALSADRKNWLALPEQDEVVEFIYQYLFENQGEEGFVALAQDAFPKIMAHPGVFHSMNPFVIVKRINDSALDACTKGILNRLKNLEGNDIATIIARFDSPESKYTINFSQAVIPNDSDGTIHAGGTIPSGIPFSYNTTLNQTFFNNAGSTNLFKAQIILHEILHSLISSVIENFSTPDNSDLGDFPTIWNAYVAHEFNGDTANAHHLFLANKYIQIIGCALQEYATGQTVTIGQADQLYTDMAWMGLIKLPSASTQFDSVLTPTDKARIYSRFNVEKNRANFNGMNPSSINSCLN